MHVTLLKSKSLHINYTLLCTCLLTLRSYFYFYYMSLPYTSSTGSSSRFDLLTLVRATSNASHEALTVFSSNHLSRVSLKQVALSRGLSFSMVLSTPSSNPSSIPISSQSLECFLITYLLRSLIVGRSFSVGHGIYSKISIQK